MRLRSLSAHLENNAFNCQHSVNIVFFVSYLSRYRLSRYYDAKHGVFVE